MFDSREIGKRIRRLIDGNYSYRKILVLIIICGGIFLYFGPPVAHWLFSSTGESVQGNKIQLKYLKILNNVILFFHFLLTLCHDVNFVNSCIALLRTLSHLQKILHERVLFILINMCMEIANGSTF